MHLDAIKILIIQLSDPENDGLDTDFGRFFIIFSTTPPSHGAHLNDIWSSIIHLSDQ